jgi:organic radical activating enzyme
MLTVDYCEFYITNVCNLNCANCNRFNNYAFSGHLNWEDHAEKYQQWSKRLHVSRIGILGGEPLLNPGFETWVRGLADAWPVSDIIIMTNGTQFDRWPNLYSLLAEYQGQIRVDVNRHDAEQIQSTLTRIEKIYPGPYKKFYINPDRIHQLEIKPSAGQDRNYGFFTQSPLHKEKFKFEDHHVGPAVWQDTSYEFAYKDKNNVFIRYGTADNFNRVAVEYNSDSGTLSLPYASDPDQAASVCGSKWSHHFLNGRLYKCNITAVLPEFIKQFPVKLTDQQQQLIDGYQAADLSWNEEKLKNFVSNLQQAHSIEQCSLCPENMIGSTFAAGHKKISIKKVSSCKNTTLK